MTVHCRVQGCTSTSTATATAPRCTQLTSGGKYIYQGQWIRCNCPECSPPGAPWCTLTPALGLACRKYPCRAGACSGVAGVQYPR